MFSKSVSLGINPLIMKKITLLSLFLFVSVIGYTQTKELYTQSIEAYKGKDYPLFLKLTKKLDSIRPSHPTYSYNLAAAYSLNKMEPEALATLHNLVLMNNTISFESEADFDFIKDSEGFQKLKELKSTQNKVIESSHFKLSLSQKDLHPEGLLYLEKLKIWLVASIRHKKIYSLDSEGKCTNWFSNTPYSVFAMKADADEKYLWITTSAMPEMEGYSKEMEGLHQILKIEISSRKLIKTFTIEGKHILGDLVIAKNGDIYISDSMEPHIYRMRNDVIGMVQDFKGKAFNLQGMALNADESKLFVADYMKGIIMIDLKNDDKAKWLSVPEGATKKGIDGLVFYKNSLFAIHNGAKPIRVIKYDLNAENNQITGFTVLDNNRADFNEPALATISNGKLYFFANSPWNFYDASGQLDETKFENPKLYELNLD